jgi:hypothetical protein
MGWPCRPQAKRITERKSITIASKQPASSQQRVRWKTALQGEKSFGSSR